MSTNRKGHIVLALQAKGRAMFLPDLVEDVNSRHGRNHSETKIVRDLADLISEKIVSIRVWSGREVVRLTKLGRVRRVSFVPSTSGQTQKLSQGQRASI
ncbi:MAG: hypothetical protein Q8Q10_03490 [bacterium]|nr:hypothetical protein [bacterium]